MGEGIILDLDDYEQIDFDWPANFDFEFSQLPHVLKEIVCCETVLFYDGRNFPGDWQIVFSLNSTRYQKVGGPKDEAYIDSLVGEAADFYKVYSDDPIEGWPLKFILYVNCFDLEKVKRALEALKLKPEVAEYADLSFNEKARSNMLKDPSIKDGPAQIY